MLFAILLGQELFEIVLATFVIGVVVGGTSVVAYKSLIGRSNKDINFK